MKPAFNPRNIERKQPRGPGTKGVLPRYVAIGNSRKVATTQELIPGRVYADFDAGGELIGVEVVQ
jgi:hypothetical protein